MFRYLSNQATTLACFPRIRGDVPIFRAPANRTCQFSPHTRGCSFFARRHEDFRRVFPAYAGMFRHHYNPIRQDISFPRIRGDVPVRRRPGLP